MFFLLQNTAERGKSQQTNEIYPIKSKRGLFSGRVGGILSVDMA